MISTKIVQILIANTQLCGRFKKIPSSVFGLLSYFQVLWSLFFSLLLLRSSFRGVTILFGCQINFLWYLLAFSLMTLPASRTQRSRCTVRFEALMERWPLLLVILTGIIK